MRKANNESPRSLRELFNMGSRWKKGSNPQISAFLFAGASFVGFALWESLIISALSLFPYLFLSFPIGVASAGALLRRKYSSPLWSFEEALWAFGTLGLLSGALFCWALFPWLYYRSLFLKKENSSIR